MTSMKKPDQGHAKKFENYVGRGYNKQAPLSYSFTQC